MGSTVFAEGMGFFHKGSNGTGHRAGRRLPDPAVTARRPGARSLRQYAVRQRSDQGQQERQDRRQSDGARELFGDRDEHRQRARDPGLGAGVVTHKIKGKGAFKLWSFTVKVEGKGVCRHGDPMAPEPASEPPNCIDARRQGDIFKTLAALGDQAGHSRAKHMAGQASPGQDRQAQKKAVNGKPCWECTAATREQRRRTAQLVNRRKTTRAKDQRDQGKDHGKRERQGNMTHDHQPPLSRAWETGRLPSRAARNSRSYARRRQWSEPHCRAHYQQPRARSAEAHAGKPGDGERRRHGARYEEIQDTLHRRNAGVLP